MIPFQVFDWNKVSGSEHAGETGHTIWKTLQFENLRVRVVEYSPGYLADHWCAKGHIVYCLEGEVYNELKTGEISKLTAGMSYIVSDDMSEHRSRTETGAKLFIIDGDFLKK